MAPKIEDYRFGHIVIDGETHTNDVIILPERVIGGWWREEGHVLHPADLDAVFDAAPDALIVGQGANGRMRVPREVERAISDASIELIAANTHDAVERYNAMRNQRDVAAALHLTC